MVDFGWSVGCIVDAIKVGNSVRKALQNAGGAQEQYSEALAFLSQSECVFKILKQHIQANSTSAYSDAIVQHLGVIEPSWTRIHVLLSKYDKSLADDSTRSKHKQIPRKIQWALKKLHEAVKEAKNEVQGPLQMVICLLQMHSMEMCQTLNEKCQSLAEDISVTNLTDICLEGFKQSMMQATSHATCLSDTKTCLDQLKSDLSQQRADVDDAFEKTYDLLQAQDESAEEFAKRQEAISQSSAQLPGNPVPGRKDSLDGIVSRLDAYQMSLNRVHETLQQLQDQSRKSMIPPPPPRTPPSLPEIPSTSGEDLNSNAISTKEVVPILSAVAATVAMFRSASSSTTTVQKTPSTCTHVHSPSEPSVRHTSKLPHMPSRKSSTQNEWASEFRQSIPQAYASYSPATTAPERGLNNHGSSTSSDPPVSSGTHSGEGFVCWFCCGCGDGPFLGAVTPACCSCNHVQCGGCSESKL